ncbi:MAG: hypothetical protein AB1610_07625 [Nitrospirota bacterium]
MKKYYLLNIIAILIIIAFLISCGSDTIPSNSNTNTSLVSITVGSDGKTASLKIEENTLFARAKMFFKKMLRPDEVVAAIPTNVNKIVFLIAASDMTSITREVTVSGQTSITENFTVPNGNNRHFVVDAYDFSGTILYSGDSFSNLDGTDVTLGITMGDFQQQVIDGINVTLTDFANTINTKGSALTNDDLMPYFHENYLNNGRDRDEFLNLLVSNAPSSSLSIAMDTVMDIDYTSKIIVAKMSYTVTTTAYAIEFFIYDTITGKWLFYGNQMTG